MPKPSHTTLAAAGLRSMTWWFGSSLPHSPEDFSRVVLIKSLLVCDPDDRLAEQNLLRFVVLIFDTSPVPCVALAGTESDAVRRLLPFPAATHSAKQIPS
jgi:hypothetical protein